MTSTEVTLRDATAADAAAIAALHVASWRASYRGAMPDAYLGEPLAAEKQALWDGYFADPPPQGAVLCAEQAGRLVGFGSAAPDPALAAGAYLSALHTAPGFYGRGTGRRLIAALARRMMAAGMRQLWLFVHEGNAGAIRLYERLGAARGLTHRVVEAGFACDDHAYHWGDLPALIALAEQGARQPGPPAIAVEAVAEQLGAPHPVEAAERAQGRRKRRLGDVFGLDQYGVNQVVLPPGVWSTVRHWHSHEDEFIYALSGAAVLVTDRGETPMSPGDCAGFKAGVADGHRIENRGAAPFVYLEIGSRRPDIDETTYPDDDLFVRRDGQGRQVFVRGDGTVVKLAE